MAAEEVQSDMQCQDPCHEPFRHTTYEPRGEADRVFQGRQFEAARAMGELDAALQPRARKLQFRVEKFVLHGLSLVDETGDLPEGLVPLLWTVTTLTREICIHATVTDGRKYLKGHLFALNVLAKYAGISLVRPSEGEKLRVIQEIDHSVHLFRDVVLRDSAFHAKCLVTVLMERCPILASLGRSCEAIQHAVLVEPLARRVYPRRELKKALFTKALCCYKPFLPDAPPLERCVREREGILLQEAQRAVEEAVHIMDEDHQDTVTSFQIKKPSVLKFLYDIYSKRRLAHQAMLTLRRFFMDAEAAYKRSAVHAPPFVEACDELSRKLIELGRHDEAESVTEMGLDALKSYASLDHREAHCLARFLLKRAKLSRARKDWPAALDHFCEARQTYVELLAQSAAMGDVAAQQARGELCLVEHGIADVYEGLGQLDKAVEIDTSLLQGMTDQCTPAMCYRRIGSWVDLGRIQEPEVLRLAELIVQDYADTYEEGLLVMRPAYNIQEYADLKLACMVFEATGDPQRKQVAHNARSDIAETQAILASLSEAMMETVRQQAAEAVLNHRKRTAAKQALLKAEEEAWTAGAVRSVGRAGGRKKGKKKSKIKGQGKSTRKKREGKLNARIEHRADGDEVDTIEEAQDDDGEERSDEEERSSALEEVQAGGGQALEAKAMCPICHLDFCEHEDEEGVVALPCCGRRHHDSCLDEWASSCHSRGWPATCPTCRAPLIRPNVSSCSS